MYTTWFIFSGDLVSFYPALHFLSMWLNGIITIINSNGNSAFPWNISPWIFFSEKLFSSTFSSTLPVFMVFSIKFMNSFDILCILKQFIIQPCRTFYCQSRSLIDFSVWSGSCWGCVLSLWLYSFRVFHISVSWWSITGV